MKNQTTNFKFVLAILGLVFVTACNNHKKIPPFPVTENEYAQPVVKEFSYPKPDTINWISQDLPALKSLPTTKFNWDKLPEKPFDIGLPYPLKKPMTSKPFDWNALESVPFNLDNLPQAELKVKVAVLGQPKIVKAGIPTNEAGATRGVMSLAAGFGLPAVAYSQLLDSDGMMWFGINNGVVKYDSQNLEIYGLDQGLEAKYTNWLFEDSKGRIWMVGNQGSISVMDRKLNLTYELSSSFFQGQLFTILEDKNGLFWIANNGNGYQIINFEEKIMYKFDTKNGLLSDGAFNIFEDKEGFLWLSTFQGVHIIDPSRTKNYTLTTANGFESNTMPSIKEDVQGRVWLTGFGGIQMLNKEKTSLSFISSENFDNEDQMITDIFQDHSGKFWIGTDNGLVFGYAEETGLLQKFIVRPTTQNDQWMYTFLENDEKEIWTVSAQGGIYKIDDNGYRPGNYRTESGIGNNNVWATMEANDGKIWIGTHDGIDVYDPVKKSLKHLGVEQGLAHQRNTNLTQDAKGRIWAAGNTAVSIIDPIKQTIKKLTTESGIKSQRISSAIEDADGSIWLISFLGEIQNIDLESSSYKTFIDKDSIVNVSRKDGAVQTDKNTLWVADQTYGLHKIDLSKNIKWRLTTDNGLISNQLFFVGKDAEKNIWIATDKGVQMLDDKNQTITTFTIPEGLGSNDVYDIKQKDGKIYLGTSKGLTILQPIKEENQTFWKAKTIGKNQGLDYIDFTQNSISFDKNGLLWAGVEGQMLTVMNEPKIDTTAYSTAITSLNIFDKKLTFQNKEKLPTENIARDSLLEQNTNDFALKNTIDSSFQKLHHIEWEQVAGPYNLPVELTLPYDQNYLSFNYNGKQFSNPDKLVYRYILEGIDKQWSPITSNTTSENYRDLPSGDYTFKVASKGFNGIWSKPAEFSFSITPPWWQTWWAYLIFASLFLGLGLVILNYRSKWLKKENKLLEEKVLIRTSELKNKMKELQATQSQLIQSEKMASLGELTAGIAHEIQNPLNFVNNFSEVNSELIDEMQEELKAGNSEEAILISNDIKENQSKINHHGKRADAIVKGMLQHSRSSSSEKEPTNINALADEYLRLAYHGLRAKDKSFNATMHTDFDTSIGKVNIVPQDVGRVILNLITNAFYAVTDKKKKSTTDTEPSYEPTVSVSTKKFEDYVEIRVKDNGNGIPKEVKDKIFQPFFTTKPSGQGTGLGLSLSYDVVKTHNGKLEVKTEENKGTEFIITLPINSKTK